ncbi:MAG: maleylpyruvate isomerase family mycothiol-dependent enzyme [Oryzihumus sp.]
MSELYPYGLGAQRYREVLEEDFARLRSVAPRALDRPVPECEGWVGADVLRHTALVYLHKVETMRRGDWPDPWPPEGIEEAEPLGLIDDAHGQLVAELDERDPAGQARTWWPPDQSVGFWVRRMAHETSVHRRDVESAAGEGTPVAADLAVDGIDEVLMIMLAGDWSDAPVGTASGAAVVVSSGGHDWEVTLGPDRVDILRAVSGGAVATVSGEPSEVLLWLWGRGPRPDVSGEEAVVTELRERLGLATR